MDISQFYLFKAPSLKSEVIVRRGEGAPRITGGGGRWETVEVPRRTSFVQWRGNDPYSMDVSVLFDGWADNDSVEADISRLNQMRMADKAADLVPPPVVFIEGALPVKGATWVITSIEWGDNVIWHTVGDSAFRYRQDAVVRLLQYVPTTALTFKRPGTITVPHTVKSGETLKTVAKKHGVSTKDIKDANGIRDGKILKPGTNLKIPKKTVPVGVSRAEGTTIR